MSSIGNIKFVLADALSFIGENVEEASVQLVYLDPPFFSGKVHSQYNKSEEKNISFNDLWSSRKEYLLFIKNILILCKEKMKDTGLIFLHCDTYANHYLRLLLDEIFGEAQFINEIIWAYKRWSNSSNKLLDSHQTIWVYSKTKHYKFKRIFSDYSPTTNIDQILQQRERNENGVVVYKRDENNNVVSVEKKEGVPLRDVWEIPYLNPKAKERVGYPTQKPIELLKRIIDVSCDEGDLILDPFCGSGSLGIASYLNNCKYLGIDINPDAIKICEKRIREFCVSKSKVLDANYSKFNVLDKEIRDFIIKIKGTPIERNKGLDAVISSKKGLVGIRFQRENESILETITLLKKASSTKPLVSLIVVKTHDTDLIEYKPSDVVILDSLEYSFSRIINK
ncbi:MAG: DNA-methyltransferase [Treponema sp.]